MYEGFLHQLLLGTWVTLEVAFAALAVGIVLGLIGAIGEQSSMRSIRIVFTVFGTIFRGVPEILTIFFIYYAGTLVLTQLVGKGNYVEVSPLLAGALALGLIFGAYASQVLRASIQAIPRGQREAAMALGLNRYYIFTSIVLPQAWRHALPGLSNLWLILLKDTSLVSLIGIADLMSRARIAVAATHKPFTFYLTAALIYLLLTYLSEQGLIRWQRRLNRPLQ